MLSWSKSLAVAFCAAALLAACGGGDSGSKSGLPCAESPTSSACADCMVKAKFEVCEEASNARLVACQACNPPEPSCDVALCAAKEQALQRCWVAAAASLCGAGDIGAGGSGGIGTGGSGGIGTGGSGGVGPGGSGGGDAGSGGAGGTGATGGTGGKSELCGGVTCAEGEICNEDVRPALCECRKSPDTCEPYGMKCTADGCVDRPVKTWDFDACDEVFDLTDDLKFICLEVGDGGGPSVWIRRCNATTDCQGAYTYCDLRYEDSFGTGLCIWNLCGDSARGNGPPVNGTNWNTCDPTTPTPGNPTSATAPGTCLPIANSLGFAFQCNQAGPRPVGSQCRFDVQRGSNQACERGTLCVSTRELEVDCRSDADCGETQVCTQGTCRRRGCSRDQQCGDEGFCDSATGFCLPLGNCTATCNAGLGLDKTPYGRCNGPGDVCWGLSATGRNDDATGYCGAPGCNLLGGPDECPAVGGQPGMCGYAGWAKGQPLMGQCGVRPAAPTRLGEECLDGPGCEQGTICIGTEADGYRCQSLCECPGGAWDVDGRCAASSPQCSGGKTCGWFGAGASMGACL